MSVGSNDSHVSDFDDDDLADLLYDESDSTSKKKEEILQKSGKQSSPKKTFEFKDSPIKNIPLKKIDHVDKQTGEAIISPVKKDDDSFSFIRKKSIDLDSSVDFKKGLENKVDKTSTNLQDPTLSPKNKGKSSIRSFLEGDSNDIDDLGLDELIKRKKSITGSPTKKVLPQSPRKNVKDTIFSKSGLFDDLDESTIKASPEKSLKNVNPKPLFKKSSMNDDEDDLGIGSYVPSSRSAVAGRRRSVRFNDENPTPRPYTAESQDQAITSPQKKNPKSDISLHQISKKSTTEDDWPSFTRLDLGPKKPNSAMEQNAANERSFSQRKSSGGEWLGFGTSHADNEEKSLDSALIPKIDQTKAVNKESSQLPWLMDKQDRMQNSNILNVAPNKQQEISNISPSFTNETKSIPQSNTAQVLATVPVQNISSISQNMMHVPIEQVPLSNFDVSSYQSLVNFLQVERDQLLQTNAMLKKMHSDEVESMQASFMREKKTLEDSIDQKLKSAKEDSEKQLEKLKNLISELQQEKKLYTDEVRTKSETLEKEHQRDIEKLKDLHNNAVAMMKQDHEQAVSRLKTLKEQEIEAICSTRSHSRSLESLSEELKIRASELAVLQMKVEGQHNLAVQEKEAFLASKEKELKALEGRLKWQMEEGDQERMRLQKIVLHLEKRLQQQTTESEEDRWEIQKTKAKLDVQWKFLEEEKKLQAENLDREKTKLRLAHESLIQEQKSILLQLAQERQQFSSEKLELEALSKRVREQETNFNTKKIQNEGFVESERRLLMQEQDKLHAEKDSIKQENLQMRYEKEALQREKRILKEEREKIDEARNELKRKSTEVEELALKANAEQEDGRNALAAARKIESGHHSRINQFTQQMQILMEKEKQLLEEKQKISHERMELENKRDSMLCANCKLAVGLPMMTLPPTIGQPQPRTVLSAAPPTTNVDPSLLVWYVSAQKDREFLQEELSYLESLKAFHKK